MMTLTEVSAKRRVIASKAKTIKTLLARPTTANIATAERLNDEATALESQIEETSRFLEMKSANAARLVDLRPSAPVITPQYQSLKYITGATRQEAELKAYKFGAWMLAHLFGNAKAINWCKSNGVPVSAKAHIEGANTAGGYLVPEGIDLPIIENREKYGVFRQNARVVRMVSDSVNIPRRTSGLTTYWLGENETITDSSMAWDNLRLGAKKLGTMMLVSSELYEDAVISLADEVAFETAFAFSQTEDGCGFMGDGTSTYRGMVGVIPELRALDSTIANIAGLFVGSGNAYSELVLADFTSTAALMPASFEGPETCWYMHRSFFWNVAAKLANAAGQPIVFENGLPLFEGYPVRYTQVMPKTEANSQVCALFGNLRRSSAFGDRRSVRLRLDPHMRFEFDQLRLQATGRFDVNNRNVGNASSVAADRVAGPIIGLITAAS